MFIKLYSSIIFITLSICLLVSNSIRAAPSVRLSQSSSSSGSTLTSSFVNISKTLSVAKSISNQSWEWGTTIEADLEVNNPELTVFNKNAFPNGKIPQVSGTGSSITGLAYAKQHIITTGNTLAPGNGAIGDPASLGVGAILLGNAKSSSNKIYSSAAQRQLTTVLNAPKFYNGAISQRQDVAELWADNMFMTPPFLAYSAVASNNVTLLRMAVQQCSLYRQVLLANTTSTWQGLWVHIVGPQSQTLGIWSTGNGWAALGMARVLATVMNWQTSSTWQTEQKQLTSYIQEIIQGSSNVLTDLNTKLLRNYLVGGANSQYDNSVIWFGDGAGTAALVAAALRLAVMQPSTASQMISFTKPFRQALASQTNSSTGILAPVVNPLNWFSTSPSSTASPEAQAFISMAGAAWRDCLNAGVCKSGQ